MQLTAEISMYPLTSGYEQPIIEFIEALSSREGIEVITNQLSTQLRGDFAAVNHAIQSSMEVAMGHSDTVVFVVKYVNTGLPITEQPKLGNAQA